MKLVTFALCDKCKKPIKEDEGFALKGNVHALKNGMAAGGIIGNAFCASDESLAIDGNESIRMDEIVLFAYHFRCFNQIIVDAGIRDARSDIADTWDDEDFDDDDDL